MRSSKFADTWYSELHSLRPVGGKLYVRRSYRKECHMQQHVGAKWKVFFLIIAFLCSGRQKKWNALFISLAHVSKTGNILKLTATYIVYFDVRFVLDVILLLRARVQFVAGGCEIEITGFSQPLQFVVIVFEGWVRLTGLPELFEQLTQSTRQHIHGWSVSRTIAAEQAEHLETQTIQSSTIKTRCFAIFLTSR